MTIPLHWQVLSTAGAVIACSASDSVTKRRNHLLLAVVVFVIAFFSLPNIAVYDGARLFLVAFPLVGRLRRHWSAARLGDPQNQIEPNLDRTGFESDFKRPRNRCLLRHALFLRAVLAESLQPRRGRSSWCDRFGVSRRAIGATPLTRSFWSDVAKNVPDGETVAVTPVLHQFQLSTIANQCPTIAAKRLDLVPYAAPKSQNETGSTDLAVEPSFVVAFRRRADTPPQVDELFANPSEALVIERHLGIPVAGLFRLDRHASPGSEQ